MLFNKKFDLVISLGEDCACSGYLRRFKLQDYSYPFDWLTHAPFSTRVDMLINNFEDFLNKNNMVETEKTETGDVHCDYWADSKYDIYFYHDYHIGVPFDIEHENVKAKYQRRINRMYNQIEKSESVLFVWFGRKNFPDKNTIELCYKKLSDKFPKQSVYLLFIEYSETKENIYLENEHVLIAKYDNLSFRNRDKNSETMGSQANNMALYSQIKMNRTYKWHIKLWKYLFVKLFIEIIPFKKLRTELRQKLKRKFYKEAL